MQVILNGQAKEILLGDFFATGEMPEDKKFLLVKLAAAIVTNNVKRLQLEQRWIITRFACMGNGDEVAIELWFDSGVSGLMDPKINLVIDRETWAKALQEVTS